MSKPLSGKGLLVAAVAVILLGACVKPAEPGVAVKSLQADIVFGVEPPGDAAPPSVAPQIIEIEESLPEPTIPSTPRPASRPAAPTCPAALETAFPEIPAGTDVQNTPAAGRYRWKANGSRDIGGTRVPVLGFVSRSIDNVSGVTSSPNRLSDPPNEQVTRIFTYDFVAEAPGGGLVVVTYEVRSNPQQQTIATTAGPVQVGEPQRGLSLVRVTTFDAGGNATGAFAPTPAVTILPLPVASGSQFTSVGVDPSTGSTLVVQGTVGRRVPVDACGEMVDGWQVTSQQVFTNAAGASTAVSYTYTVASQLGGMLVFEKTEPAANAPTGTSTEVLELTIGQARPSPEQQ